MSDWDIIDVIALVDKPVVSPWLLVFDGILAGSYLSLLAEGRWLAVPGSDTWSGPDGRSDLPFVSEALLFPLFPIGTLLAKIGGSAALAPDGLIFAVGSRCVIERPEKSIGPVFIGINRLKCFPEFCIRSLKLTLAEEHS